MKRWQISKPVRLLLLCCLMIMLIIITGTVQAQSDISVVVHGQSLYSDVSPIIVNSRTLVPMSAIFNALGAQVYWDGPTQTVRGYRGNDEIILGINSYQALVNGQTIYLDAPAIIYNGRTMVPVGFIATSLGETVRWDAPTQTVYIGTDSTLTPNQAMERVNQVAHPGYPLEYIDQETRDDGHTYYVVKAYDTIDDGGGNSHTTEVGWYYVDTNDGSVYSWDMTDDSLHYLG